MMPDSSDIYLNSETAMETIASNHPFDQTVMSEISVEQTGSDRVRVTVEGEDGTSLELELSFDQTVGTRLLNAMVALTPKAVARTQLGCSGQATRLYSRRSWQR